MENKIKEEELKTIKEQQEELSNLLSNIGVAEAQKHALPHEIVEVNKKIEKTKGELEKEYGAVNINLEDGTYTEIKEDVEGNKED